MKYALLIAWREYAENARTKGFWVGLFLFPAIWILAIQVPMFLEKKGTPTRHFVLVDASGQFEAVATNAVHRGEQRRVLEALKDYAQRQLAQPAEWREFLGQFANASGDALDRFTQRGGQEWLLREIQRGLRTNAPAFVAPTPRFRRVELPAEVLATGTPTEVAEQLRPWLRGERRLQVDGRDVPLFAAVLIPTNVLEQIRRPADAAVVRTGAAEGIHYWSENLADEALRSEIERAVNTEVRRREYVSRGLDGAAVRAVEQTYAPFTSLNPKKERGEEQVGMADRIRQWLPSVFVYLLWVAIFAISQMLLNSVIEEKSNRIIEVLLSSVTPGELMMGKLLGIASIGLTMLGVWIFSFVVVLWWKASGVPPGALAAGSGGGMASLPMDIVSIVKTTWLLPAFAVYFFLGYLLYAGLFLALGSTCNTIKDAQNYMGVIVLFLMVPLFAMTYIPRDPNGPVATFLSWIPPYTPFVMMNRVTADPPLRDLIGTFVLLVAFTALVLWGCGRIFRIGILRTGQPPKLVELIRWLRTK